MIEKIISIAEKAGRIIVDVRQSGDFDICVKDDGSPVTRADHVSDKYIRNALQDQFRIPVITEESGICYSSRKDRSEFFLVGPLDGTKDYIDGRGDFTVNLIDIIPTENGFRIFGKIAFEKKVSEGLLIFSST